MRRARDAGQDVEVVEVDVPLPGEASGTASAADPVSDEEHRARVARRRRLLRRWWPVPLVLVAAAVTTQVVLDARERDRVAARQEVPGVLRTVDPALTPAHALRDDQQELSLTDVVAGGLRIAFATGSWGDAREVVALDRTGRTVWEGSLDPDGAGAPTLQFPSCAADPAGTVLRCLVVDRDTSDELEDASGWMVDAPVASRLVALDLATGEPLASGEAPPLSGFDGEDGVQVLASVVDATLRVTAWAADAVPPGTDLLATEPLWRTEQPLDDGPGGSIPVERLTYPPSPVVGAHHVLVHTDVGTWALDPATGAVATRADGFLTVSRTGHLTTDGSRLLDDAGEPLLDLPGQPVFLVVDDGALPDTELVVSPGRSGEGRRLVAVAVPSGEERWSAPADGWSDGGLVLLDGLLYGSGSDGVWARDAATGREVWRTGVGLTAEMGSTVLTDGRYLLLTALPDQLAGAGVTVAPGAAAGLRGAADVPARALVALDLASGAPAWATALPAGVRAVWSDQGDLVGWGDEAVVLLN
ncbi:outer membrane protein assembly factor BamB family protein [Cellulomonas triticagri]|uniref:Pyrrolo-quinoline quinone repeat domain-containing protein n=1 Tax=Cellulomonas triticagri TaxID=2483352 RepID=A0A3M2JR33_9CELL|nr:PQQ-binding-like beta-propeller repeat protein [Cellulomonas triticagri]RMI12678.1 hypothetical protein EBM89_07785 [Cellulomonas triticagri]